MQGPRHPASALTTMSSDSVLSLGAESITSQCSIPIASPCFCQAKPTGTRRQAGLEPKERQGRAALCVQGGGLEVVTRSV